MEITTLLYAHNVLLYIITLETERLVPVLKHYAMKTYGEAVIKLHKFVCVLLTIVSLHVVSRFKSVASIRGVSALATDEATCKQL